MRMRGKPYEEKPLRWKPWFKSLDWGWFCAARPDGLKYWISKHEDGWWDIYFEPTEGTREKIGEKAQLWSAEERCKMHWEKSQGIISYPT